MPNALETISLPMPRNLPCAAAIWRMPAKWTRKLHLLGQSQKPKPVVGTRRTVITVRIQQRFLGSSVCPPIARDLSHGEHEAHLMRPLSNMPLQNAVHVRVLPSLKEMRSASQLGERRHPPAAALEPRYQGQRAGSLTPYHPPESLPDLLRANPTTIARPPLGDCTARRPETRPA